MLNRIKHIWGTYKMIAYPFIFLAVLIILISVPELSQTPTAEGAFGLHHYEKNTEKSLYLVFAPFPLGFF